jgi:putative heme-binding domain-containing protein
LDREETEFIGGRDMWFRPIEVRTGPDGAMYIIDFYNQAVIHNDTRGTKHGPRNAAIRPDRDHYYGRIWRVDHKDAKKLEVPNLAKATPADLVQALEVPNRHTRMNAMRLIVEGNSGDVIQPLKKMVVSQKAPEARVAGLWALARLNQFDEITLTAVASDANPAIRKNVMRVAAAQPNIPSKAPQQAALRNVNDPDPQVRLAALVALQGYELTDPAAKALVLAWPSFDDAWSQSAFLGVAAQSPERMFAAAMVSPNSAQLASLTSRLGPLVAGSAVKSGQLIVLLSKATGAANAAKAGALEGLAPVLKLAETPAWDIGLQNALVTLANSTDARVSAAALPFIAKWDTSGTLKAELQKDIGQLLGKLGDATQPDDTRIAVVNSLLSMRQANPGILPAVVKLLGTEGSAAVKLRVVQSLSEVPDAAIGVQVAGVYPQLNAELQAAAFDLLAKRAEWSLALLEALQSGKVPASAVGPGNTYRLRTHPVAEVATRAKSVFDALRGPEAKEKQALIDKLLAVVTQSGNAAKGKELFTANCATCHKLGDLGNEVGPNLTGMGAHGPEELLTAILDPNREVDPSFVAFSVETRDDDVYDGVVVRQNAASIVLKNAAGEKDIPRTSIKSQRNTGRSLMPEGFEALTGEGLRDVLTFLCADYARFRFIDLTSTFTASTKNGLYASARESGGTLPVSKFGIVNALGVPFKVADPAKQPGGNNIMVLKGGPDDSHSKTLPQKVEAKVGHEVKQLHILGNVAGWGFPYGGGSDVPALKITAQYAGGAKEELTFKNGVEFADYIREVNVPGSKLAPGIADGGKQMRLVSKPLAGKGVVEKLIFESFNNGLAPTTLAVTADLSNDPLPAAPKAQQTTAPAPNQKGKKNAKGKNAPVQVASAAPVSAPAGLPAPSAQPFDWKGGNLKALLVGGGSSHDFNKFFNLADVAILKGAGMAVHYTENPDDTVRELKNVDAVVLSVNRAEWATPELRKALFDFAAAGKGIVLLHAGVWYNFKDWPEYNRQIAGGGSRGHDKLGEFSVNVIKDHPITAGVSKTFTLTDELYYMNSTPDPEASPIEVLAQTSNSIKFMTPHPSVWLVKHPQARIAGIALGHDERAHDHADFKKLLINAVKWSAGK